MHSMAKRDILKSKANFTIGTTKQIKEPSIILRITNRHDQNTVAHRNADITNLWCSVVASQNLNEISDCQHA